MARLTDELSVPVDIITSLISDRLAIFAGAGISADNRIKLPKFREFIKRIERIQRENRSRSESYEHYLGRLQDSFGIIHMKTLYRQEFRIDGTKFNELHENILSLFRSEEKVRIVTTNIDRGFNNACSTRGFDDVKIYSAPALPLGNDFTGIVYLHGFIDDYAGKLVFSDRDFSEAYLTQGWARRFLIELFNNYTVLFIGYSHNDVILQYLARGLPFSKLNRFALVPQNPNLAFWDSLGIKVIEYPKLIRERKHKKLIEALSILGTRVDNNDFESSIEYEDLYKFISSVEDDINRNMISIININLALRYRNELVFLWAMENFKHNNTFENWILNSIYYENEQLDDNTRFLWHYLIDQRGGFDAREYGRFEALGLSLGNSLSDKSYLLSSLYYLTKPRVFFTSNSRNDLQPGSGMSISSLVSLRIYANEDILEQLKDYINAHIDEIALDVINMMINHIEIGHNILRVFGRVTNRWDIFSLDLTAIEANQQNFGFEDLSQLVIITRICLNNLVERVPEVARSLIEGWALSQVPVIRRLAVYGIGRL